MGKGQSRAGIVLDGIRLLLPCCRASLCIHGFFLIVQEGCWSSNHPIYFLASRREKGQNKLYFFSIKMFLRSNTCHFHSYPLVIHIAGKNVAFIIGSHCSFLGSLTSEGKKVCWDITVGSKPFAILIPTPNSIQPSIQALSL